MLVVTMISLIATILIIALLLACLMSPDVCKVIHKDKLIWKEEGVDYSKSSIVKEVAEEKGLPIINLERDDHDVRGELELEERSDDEYLCTRANGYGIEYLRKYNKSITDQTKVTTRFLISQLNSTSKVVESVTTQESVNVLFVMSNNGFCYEVCELEIHCHE